MKTYFYQASDVKTENHIYESLGDILIVMKYFITSLGASGVHTSSGKTITVCLSAVI